MEAVLQELLSWVKDIQIDQWGVAYLVLIFPIAVSFYFDLQLHREMLVVSVRATLQLILIALILLPVFQSHWSIQISLIAAMLFMGAVVARERGKRVPKAFAIALLSMIISYGAVIFVFLITGALEIIPNIVIPISGMLIGNASRTISLNFHKTYNDFDTHKAMLEAMMIDGAEYSQAVRVPSQYTLKTALVPRIDSLKTLGIVHIPGAMAGMMVAGASPLAAAGYQILIFFGIVSISALSSIVANTLGYRSVFVTTYPHLKRMGW